MADLPPVTPALRAILEQQRVLVQVAYGRQAAAWNPEREAEVMLTIEWFYQFAVLSHFTPFARLRSTEPMTRHLRPELCWMRIVEGVRNRLLPEYQCPCQGCFHPTGSWCESCDNKNRAICTECERVDITCRECR